MEDLTITIQGMSCGHCVQGITKILSNLKGVKVDQVKIGEATLGFILRPSHPNKLSTRSRRKATKPGSAWRPYEHH